MKKLGLAVSVLMLSLLVASYVIGNRALAIVDFDAYAGTAIPDSLIDGTVGTEWNDSGHYVNVPITPSGTAEIWTKNDGIYLYMAIKFTADSNNPWLALQLGTTGCMDNGADGAIFGNDNLPGGANGYVDTSFGGVGSVSSDATQNGAGAVSISAGNVMTVELKKPLSSGDNAGKDIAWTQGNTYSLVIAWDSDGDGSSGGATNHTSGGLTARNILIDPNAKPEITNVRTSLTINAPPSISQNEELLVSVTLQDEAGIPVSNATVTFSINTTFRGTISIGSVQTDSAGQASFKHTIKVDGSYTIEAIFAGSTQGTVQFEPSDASATVVVEPEETAQVYGPKDPFYNWGVFIFNRPQTNPPLGFGLTQNGMAVGILSLFYLLIISVYVTLLYVVSLFVRIAKGGKKST